VHYLIDGYNVAHWLLRDDEARPEQLRAALLAALPARLPRGTTTEIFWDVRRPSAVPPNEYLGWCTVRNVPDADAAILEAVSAAENPRTLTVVSRDREVTGKSRQLGANILAPVDLLGRRGRA